MLFSGTGLSPSRFISSSVTKANRFSILTFILIANLTHFEVFEIGEYHRIFPSFSWGIFGHVSRLAQLRASEKYLMDYNVRYTWRGKNVDKGNFLTEQLLGAERINEGFKVVWPGIVPLNSCKSNVSEWPLEQQNSHILLF